MSLHFLQIIIKMKEVPFSLTMCSCIPVFITRLNSQCISGSLRWPRNSTETLHSIYSKWFMNILHNWKAPILARCQTPEQYCRCLSLYTCIINHTGYSTKFHRMKNNQLMCTKSLMTHWWLFCTQLNLVYEKRTQSISSIFFKS